MKRSERSASSASRELRALDAELIDCRRCARLVQWREDVAVTKRAAFLDQEYWGRPVPAFGFLDPRILIVGLAPAAHGANRTGRMFTGDRSGDWLFASLHRCGLARSPTSSHVGDGQSMELVRITAAVHCAPPANVPTVEERRTCATWLDRELAITWPRLAVVVALGGIAFEATLAAASRLGVASPGLGIQVPRPKPKFGHGVEHSLGRVTLIGSYHPSQQNTFTGRLTEPMLDAVMTRAKRLASA